MAGRKPAPDQTARIEADAAIVADRIAQVLVGPAFRRPTQAQGIETLRCLLDVAQQAALRERRALGVGLHPLRSQGHDRSRRLRQQVIRLRLWDQVLATLAQIERRQCFPLLSADHDRMDLRRAEHRIGDHSFTSAHRLINPAAQSASAERLGCYADIPTRVGLFLRIAHLAYRITLAQRRPGPTRFLDVGCGGGMKVAMGARFFDAAQGIEYDPAYAEVARQTLHRLQARRCAIIEGDALAFDGYGAFDVIFLYRPLQDDARLAQLEARILAQARPGAVILAPYEVAGAHWQGATRIADHVHVAGLQAGATAGLLREVRRIGPHVADPDARLPKAIGWLSPLWQACLAAGFDPAAWAPA